MNKIELYNNFCKKCKKMTVMTPFQVLGKRGIKLCCINCQKIAPKVKFSKLVKFDYELEEKRFDEEQKMINKNKGGGKNGTTKYNS